MAHFGSSGFSSLSIENPLELVTSTSASIVELDSNAGPSSLPAKHKRSHHSRKHAIMSAPANEWDSNDMVNFYGLDIEGEIAKIALLMSK